METVRASRRAGWTGLAWGLVLVALAGLLGGCGADPRSEVASNGNDVDPGDAGSKLDTSAPGLDASLPDAVRLETGTDADADADSNMVDTGVIDASSVDSATDAGEPDASECVVWDPSGRPKLVIDEAMFGTGNTWADDTAAFQNLVTNDWLYYHVYRTYIDMGDPAPGVEKVLRLSYQLDGVSQPEKTYHEGDIIYLNVPPQHLECCDWQLTSAKWGTDEASAIDVTSELKKFILDCVLDFYCFSGNKLAGDPAPGALKHLYIEYQVHGTNETFVCDEEGAQNHILVP